VTIALEAPLGSQRPRVFHAPPGARSGAGREAIELAALAGLILDPWEAYVLDYALGEGVDRRWAAAEVGLCVPRQNGKNVILEARELAGLFLFEEDLLIHSAQHFKTAKEHFLRLLASIEGTPEFSRRVKRIIRSHGEEGIELTDGRRILFFARTKSSGRGFSAPFVAFDEAMFLAESTLGALLPTQAAQENRQRWYAGSAVDQVVHPDGVVFARVRERGLAGEDDRLAYFEWSVDAERPDLIAEDAYEDVEEWATSNPGLGIRVSEEAIRDELRTLDLRTFAVERLGVGDWPPTTAEDAAVVAPEAWAELVDEDSTLEDPICFAFDVTPDRSTAAIAAAGRRADGLFHVEVVQHRRGTGWIVDQLVRLRDRWYPIATMCDPAGPAASLIPQCETRGFPVEPMSARDHANACGLFVDLVEQQALRHLGTAELASALRGATRRQLGDAWAWSRRNSAVDISPLVAVTLALWGAQTLGWDPNSDPVIY
jgi:hypothetical protein